MTSFRSSGPSPNTEHTNKRMDVKLTQLNVFDYDETRG
jgi:hypothetical protein